MFNVSSSPPTLINKVAITAESSNFTIQYAENLNEIEWLDKISAIPNPHVLLWYIGSYGLKQDCVQFYKNKIHHILNSSNQATCWLLDFTAWGAFVNIKAKITSSHKCAEQINQFNLQKLKCLSAAKLFKEMQNLPDKLVINHFREHVVTRPYLTEMSNGFPDSLIKIGDIFGKNCPIFEKIYGQDANKSYSTIQYVEGCFIINEIVKSNLDHKDDINIVFALPNDEAKYYRDEENNFIKDAALLVQTNWSHLLGNRKINIYFLNFTYGNESQDRPYNSGKKTLKNITPNMVL